MKITYLDNYEGRAVIDAAFVIDEIDLDLNLRALASFTYDPGRPGSLSDAGVDESVRVDAINIRRGNSPVYVSAFPVLIASTEKFEAAILNAIKAERIENKTAEKLEELECARYA